MSNEETTKLTRISLQNWGKENNIELEVQTHSSPSFGYVTVVIVGDIKIFHYYDFQRILVMDSNRMISLEEVTPGLKISERIIQEIQKHLK